MADDPPPGSKMLHEPVSLSLVVTIALSISDSSINNDAGDAPQPFDCYFFSQNKSNTNNFTNAHLTTIESEDDDHYKNETRQ